MKFAQALILFSFNLLITILECKGHQERTLELPNILGLLNPNQLPTTRDRQDRTLIPGLPNASGSLNPFQPAQDSLNQFRLPNTNERQEYAFPFGFTNPADLPNTFKIPTNLTQIPTLADLLNPLKIPTLPDVQNPIRVLTPATPGKIPLEGDGNVADMSPADIRSIIMQVKGPVMQLVRWFVRTLNDILNNVIQIGRFLSPRSTRSKYSI